MCADKWAGQCPPSAFGIVEYLIRGERTVDMRANGRIFGVRLSLLLWLPAQRIPEDEWLIWRGRTDLCTSERAGQCPTSAFGIVEYPIRGERTVDMRANGQIFGVRLSLLL